MGSALRGLALLALVSSSSALAQTDYSVTGRVLEAETGAPVETASVALWRVSARRGVEAFVETGAVTDSDGSFRVEGLSRGRYYAVVRFLGFEPVTTDTLRLRPDAPSVDLGTIVLEVDATALGDVEVSAERDRIEIQVDRTVYRISDDPLLSGASTSEALETLPSVEVDIEGNVSLRGVSNVVILVDGRPAPVGRDFVAVYLQSLPAEAVESIEVIPNPSATFQPDGSGGILNIVLKDDTELGIGGALTTGADTRGGYQGNALVTYGRGPLRLSATAAYRENVRDADSDRLRINRFLGPSANELSQTSVSARTRSSALTSLSADLALTPQTTLTASANGTLRGGGSDDHTDLLVRDLGGLVLEDGLRTSIEDEDGLSGSVRLGLRHDFEGVSEETADERPRGRRGGGGRGRRGRGSRVSLGTHGLALDLRLNASANDELGTLAEAGLDRRTTRDDARQSATFQADYARPIGDTRFEAGYRGDLETQITDLLTEADLEGDYTVVPGQTYAYDLDNQVHAGYVQLARQLGDVAIQAGLRGEIASRTFTLGGESFEVEDTSLFPSASATVDLGTLAVLRASYSRRVDRPRGRQLNPFPSIDDPLNVRVGNPELRPEFTDALEVSAIRQTDWGMVTVTPFLRRTTDVVRRFQTVDAQGVTTSTFRNLDESTSSGLEAVVSYQGGGALRGFVSLEGFRRQTDGSGVEDGLAVDAFGWGGRVNANYGVGDRFGWGDLDLQATASYRAPQDTEQGRITSRVFFDLGLRQRLLDGRASLAIRARDPFNWAQFGFTQDDDRIFQTFNRSFGRQQVGLTFTYAFGQTEERPDRQRQGDGGGAAEPVDF
ncbi:TonB-dependent receptor domain-containing protein [Rubrivirga sp.]|uniref:TonB-dependent receptor domain-containing protein n=1 Tax=Rubrivirga sp. TaxID=1885344 RepID=UPI003C720313